MAHTSFTPYSSTSTRPPVIDCAVEAYRGDINVLAQAGAEIIGTVEADGNGYASTTWVKEAAAEEAALHGGTHFIVGTAATDVSAFYAVTNSYGSNATTTVTPITTHSAAVLVLRVPWKNLNRLPRQLWPKPGTHYDVESCHYGDSDDGDDN